MVCWVLMVEVRVFGVGRMWDGGMSVQIVGVEVVH